ncbi:hypothetical protein DFQ27_001242 [Actinomortierella ambigua]|uniref:Enoyl reductase (ER) domain-containing protein n=1 Tax=Actinomortierella ambigua TaxID=1343610 RepID=A0A9P6QIR1_9FUNG|nr:hypothetical protein DFQ26_004242 [Actinomortierella ambigua]KAG0269981.1 hypothetical protein DFQ27_001242 [Actinomortierella ambigua]
MGAIQNTQIVLASRPVAEIDPDTAFRLQKVGLSDELGADEILVKVLYISLDPAMRGWMRDIRSYVPPVQINEVMRSADVAQVIKSNNKNFKVGDLLTGTLGWQSYAKFKPTKDTVKINVFPGVSPSTHLGMLGLTGLTAYFGLHEVGEIATRASANHTVVVSGAAGATGLVAAQICKHVYGCRVIGIAGSQDKCEYLTKEIGLDAALNYKSKTFFKDLCAVTPKYIDTFFDNTGGDILDACLRRIAFKGRIIVCGAISTYNDANPKGPAYYSALITQRARMEGFIVFDYAKKYGQAIQDMSQWIKEGKLQSKETITEGIENAPTALVRLFKGDNTGKMLIRVAEADPVAKL